MNGRQRTTIGAPLGSGAPPDAARVRHDRFARRGALRCAADPAHAERGTARLLRDLDLFGDATRREPAIARLDALQPWLSALAYALGQQLRVDGLAHES
jgi:hypothetical protein